jgi:hypothetical protein
MDISVDLGPLIAPNNVRVRRFIVSGLVLFIAVCYIEIEIKNGSKQQ